MTKAKRALDRAHGSSPTPEKRSAPLESEEILQAIRHGRVDALVVAAEHGDQVVVLQGAENPYRVLIDAISDGAATLDSDGIVLYANKRFVEILSISQQNFIGSSLQSHFPPSGREKLENLIHGSLHSSSQEEITFDVESGRQRLIRFSLNPLRNSEHLTICVVATEMTALLEATEALKSNEESLRQLSARLLQLQDEERRRIARDLHDITGQKLAVQSMLLGRLDKASTGVDEEWHRVLAECKTLTGQLVDEIRTVSYLLHPPLLDELGLASAVQWYTEGFSRRTGIVTEADISANLPRLPPDVEVTLFRIVQESLTNVHRYSGSQKAYVHVKSTGDQITVEVGDYGRGMRPEMLNPMHGTVAPIGVGIQGMTERMRQLLGKLEITSRANEGTVVTATLPIAHLRILDSEETEDNRAGSSSDPVQSIAHKRILIADDHEMLRRGVRTLLQTELDWEICGEAVNGQEAVEKAGALHPDLVIIDIDMPVLNGLAATRQILRHRPQTKILIFTVHESDRMVKDIYATGAHGCLSKDKGAQDLLRVVKELFGNSTKSASATAPA